jgi:hypothetical protein
VDVLRFGPEQVAAIDPDFRSFRNINTPEEYFGLRSDESGTRTTAYPLQQAVG